MTPTETSRAPSKSQLVYHVYVIELDSSLRKGDKPAVYVGETASTPEERFEQHRSGYKSSRWVRKYGTKLRPRLYRSYNPIATRDEAKATEARLAAKLRRRGYTVFGGH